MAFTLNLKILFFLLYGFVPKQEELTFTAAKSRILAQYKTYNAEKDFGAKTTSFEISDNGFIRYRRTAPDNKSEYYSVKLDKFKDASYLGDEKAGWLLLEFTDEAVIYQTYNDKTGNVDEMLTEIKIPLKNIDVNDINSLYDAMKALKQSGI